MDAVRLSTRAYAKILLHAAKYPHCCVNGLLLAENENKSGDSNVVFVDAIPLFHINVGLCPMTEIALLLVENRKLSLDLQEPALVALQNCEGKWKSTSFEFSEVDTLVATSALLQNKAYRQFVDFDNHFDDVSADWTNNWLEDRLRHIV